MRYVATVSYNGSNYQGWQRQNNVVTIQEIIEEKFSLITNSQIKIHASGRTDSGVHALGQVFHFDVKNKLQVKRITYSLNKLLPPDIVINKISRVSDDFHARKSAKKKLYIYKISSKNKDPFEFGKVLFEKLDSNITSIRQFAKLFIGKHSFANFTTKEIDEGNFIREIFKVKVSRNEHITTISFLGTGFMRSQIRMMVGTIIAVANHKIDKDFITRNLDPTIRKVISYKVSGSGLYLAKVFY